MDFKLVFKTILKKFKENEIDCALIGAFAFQVTGIFRATEDIDFLIPYEKAEKVKEIMENLTYNVVQMTKNFSQYESPLKMFGYVDFLHTSGKYTIEMLQNAETHKIMDEDIEVKVIRLEDIIGLKVLSYTNNPARYEKDVSDIKEILRLYFNEITHLDLSSIKEYFRILNKEDDYRKFVEDVKNEAN